MFAFFNSAVLWLLMEAEFLAIVLVLVYVGAVMVLFLFVVMMLDINVAQMREGFTRYAPLGILIAALVVVAEIGSVVWVKSLGVRRRRRRRSVAAGGLQQHARARRAAVHQLSLSVRAGGGDPAGRHRRRDRADHAASRRPQGAGRRRRRWRCAPRTASASSRCRSAEKEQHDSAAQRADAGRASCSR